jgi:serine O-acetyltransferase
MFFQKITSTIREDIQACFDRDPAARSVWEILFTYSGFHAIWVHRIAHWMWTHHIKLPARILAHVGRLLTGIEIHPAAEIGPGFFIDHGMGVVIGETTVIGRNVTLYHGVTLGGVRTEKGKRHPTIGDDVVIGAGAKILGAVDIGTGTRIGANAVVVKPVPPDSIVVGVPGQIVIRKKSDAPFDLDHGRMPDTLGESLEMLTSKVNALESVLQMMVFETGYANGNGHEGYPVPLSFYQKTANENIHNDFVI